MIQFWVWLFCFLAVLLERAAARQQTRATEMPPARRITAPAKQKAPTWLKLGIVGVIVLLVALQLLLH